MPKESHSYDAQLDVQKSVGEYKSCLDGENGGDGSLINVKGLISIKVIKKGLFPTSLSPTNPSQDVDSTRSVLCR